MQEQRRELLDRPEITNVLFHPRPDFGLPEIRPGTYTVRIPVADGVEVGGKIFEGQKRGGGSRPVMLYFHGNGEIASDYDELSRLYTSMGITLFVVDYRGYGRSDGSPGVSTLLADARRSFEAAPDVLSGRGVECGQLYVMGRSLGSAAALEVVDTAEREVSGLILESGFADTFGLIRRIGGTVSETVNESDHGFGNLDKISRADLPTLIIHGEEDWIIPVADGLALHRASAASDKRLLTIPGAGHNDLMLHGRGQYFTAIADLCLSDARD